MAIDSEGGDEVNAYTHSLGFDDGMAEGLRIGHASALAAEETGRARLAAYRAAVRQARRELQVIIQALPPEVGTKLSGAAYLLEQLS